MLNARDYATFEEIDRSGSVLQFRARINESANSEVMIYIDEKIALPVKQEFYSIEGDRRVLQYSVELQNFRAEVDPGLFVIPKDLRRESRSR